MTEIGFVSDIHANKVALDAVLEDMGDIDKLVCCGDVIGYGPKPSECVEVIREKADLVVRGNHDRSISNPDKYRSNPEAKAGLVHAKEGLSKDQLDWLASLRPTQWEGKVHISHSHPGNEDEYVFKRDFPKMGSHAHLEALVFGLGHTHQQAMVDLSQFDGGYNVKVLNPGSVGHPRDGDPRADYALVSIPDGAEEASEVDVYLRSVEYDKEKTAEQVRDAGLPEDTALRILTGK